MGQDQGSNPVVEPPVSSNGDRPVDWQEYINKLQQGYTAGIEQEVNLTIEDINVQAAYHYLSSLGIQMWAEFTVAEPHKRLKAARWLALQYEAVERVLRDPNWQPA